MISKFLTVLMSVFLPLSSWAANNVTLTKDNVIVFNSQFDEQTASKLVQWAKSMDSLTPSTDPLYVILRSPGGEVGAGIEMIQNLNQLNRPVVTITQFAASMGFHTVQGVKGKRYILPNGVLMSHRAKGGFSGEFPGQFDTRYQFALSTIGSLNEKAVARTNGKYTLASYQELIRDEYWCTGSKCVSDGFADEVINATCGESLSGTHNDTMVVSFMGLALKLDIEISNCPLITGVLGLRVNVNDYEMEDAIKYLPTETVLKIEEKVKEVTNNLYTNKLTVIKY